MSIWRFAKHLHDTPASARLTLGEGDTPIVRSRRIGPAAGLNNLYFKLETVNPSGSYKDRFAAAAVSDMVARGMKRCLATSSGNTGSALAAYCAAAGLPLRIAVVDGAPAGKLRQMQAYGASLFSVRGFGNDPAVAEGVNAYLQQQVEAGDAMVQISAFKFSPVGMTGVQTIAYELIEQLSDGINHVFCPAGGGGLTLATARGFEVIRRAGESTLRPAVHVVQPEGNDTIATPLREGADRARAVYGTSTVSGLQVGWVIDGDQVIAACRASGGSGHVITDDMAYQLQARLAREEGVFCEPAGAVALAGALKAAKHGAIAADAVTVCLVTGTGFKHEKSLARMTGDDAMKTYDSAAEIED